MAAFDDETAAGERPRADPGAAPTAHDTREFGRLGVHAVHFRQGAGDRKRELGAGAQPRVLRKSALDV